MRVSEGARAMKNQRLIPALVALAGLSLAAGCRPRADAFVKIQHPAVAGNVEANEVEWNDGAPFGLSKDIFRNVASLTEMSSDQVCFEIILSGFDDESVGDLSRAGFLLYIDGERYTPKVEQFVEPHKSEHKGKKTEFETVDTGLRENVCVDGLRNDRGEIVSCTRWQQNAITQTHAYDVPMMYNVVQGAGQACFDTKGKTPPSEIANLLLEISNSKSERTSGYWGVRYKATTRLRWDLLGDVAEEVKSPWGGQGGTHLAAGSKKAEPREVEPEPEAEEEVSIEKTGIPACDSYVEHVMKCADKQKPTDKKAMQQNAAEASAKYKEMAEGKAGKGGAATACKAKLATFQKANADAGCK